MAAVWKYVISQRHNYQADLIIASDFMHTLKQIYLLQIYFIQIIYSIIIDLLQIN